MELHKNSDNYMIAIILTEFFGCLGYSLCYNLTNQIELIPLFLVGMVICTQKVSGGHINPAVTFGVYLEHQRYGTKFCFALTLIIAQMLGGLVSLMFGYCIRVTMERADRPNFFYFVPDQNPFFPLITDETSGAPAYGQVFLAEALGGAVLTYAVLSLKLNSKQSQDLYTFPIGYAVCQAALIQLFKEVSGGVFNPCLAFAQICWQNLTYYYSKTDVDGAYWTPEYAVSYILGPMVGAYFGANMFNLMKIMLKRLKDNNVEIDENDEELKEHMVNKFAFSLTQQMESLKNATNRDNIDLVNPKTKPNQKQPKAKKKKGRSRSAN